MNNDEKLIMDSITNLGIVQVDMFGRVIWTPESQPLVDAEIRKARAEVIDEVKLEVLKLVEGLSDPEPYIEFNDVINILTKLSEGKTLVSEEEKAWRKELTDGDNVDIKDVEF